MATAVNKPPKSLPVIALLGRVNVGKSRLFNRLIGESKAIVSTVPGTTRTNNEGVIVWRGVEARLIDTGGLTFSDQVPLENSIIQQSKQALAEADAVVLVTDGQVGILSAERLLAKHIRRLTKKPVLVVANKVDTNLVEREMTANDWLALGFGAPLTTSAVNGRNVGDFLDRVFTLLHKGKIRPKVGKSAPAIRISVIGKPNVGKSSLFNKLIGEEKVIVSPMPHTTREPHDTLVHYSYTLGGKTKTQAIIFVDTAGIRRKAHVEGELEQKGIQKSIQAIGESDLVLFVLDGSQPISSQDCQLGGLLEKRVKSVIIIINKWDLAEDNSDHNRNEVKRMIYRYFPHLDYAPIVFASGLTGYRVQTIFPMIAAVWRGRQTTIPAPAIDTFLRQTVRRHLPTKGRGTRHPELLGMRQVGENPPVFEVVIKYRTSVHMSYVHYLERQLREQFDFLGTPIMIKLTKMKR
ncbi:MAG: ribosome biogenesis GTPase Der [Candidatus Magasanikbacteria bacterium]|nr:ribosome biogenesis GTPase Der [Candidatus Magasanikbacteria bacterium]